MRGTYRCTSCTAYFRASRVLCGVCGTPGLETDRKRCPGCGSSYSDSPHQHCPRCGSDEVELVRSG
ncbi:zinc ribbon domain-containing protein [Natrarchaeobius chitinivorans]|uniref:Zinc ribbon domain-containing protein n=1 Tax=Natrarchaeobius chitinivorans TaxID=1679083 RepID=A0A3N6P3N3_NATCH|nr:zinc ribbon domain-containing protein [Natrarchaeobius chitinivorans]RQG92369.1 hypothetical protein EA473_16425 [Natrarchaeobius chitinivorans]